MGESKGGDRTTEKRHGKTTPMSGKGRRMRQKLDGSILRRRQAIWLDRSFARSKANGRPSQWKRPGENEIYIVNNDVGVIGSNEEEGS